jgi:hypothetical protein
VIVVDVNLLLYAVITGFPRHDDARRWWEETLNSDTEVGLTSPAIFGFLRIATNPRILESPMPIGDAVHHVQDWLHRANVRYLVPGPHHMDIAFDLLTDMGTAGNLTTDAQLAAYAIENQAEICSNDTDFARFPQLRWVNPLA